MDFGIDEHLKIAGIIDGKLVLQVLERLGDNYKEVVVMRYLDGLTPAEIAEILGESPNAISIRINRGINRLRQLLKDNGVNDL